MYRGKDAVWDERKGWINPNKGVIKLKKPSLDYFYECVERYDNADWNPEWHTKPSKLPAKIGIKKKDEPCNVFSIWYRKRKMFDWKVKVIKTITFFIPNGKVEVIE